LLIATEKKTVGLPFSVNRILTFAA